MASFKYSPWDFILTLLGLPLFLTDIALDVLAAKNFYQEQAYTSLSVLLVLLIGSSLLAQVYSWLWYKYDEFKFKTKVENLLFPGMKVLHVLQLGTYIRHAAVLETAGGNFFCNNPEGDPVFLSHDLAMLRIIETFAESAPQIVLMVSSVLQEGRWDLITALKAVGSVSAVAFCVTTYHRSLRSFLPEKAKHSIISSIVYFFWNLLLLLSRLSALALFASVLPCFIFTHFFCSWLVLFFIAWRSKTSFMDSPFGEWLYRGTVGLIWYFDWFNVVEGKTRNRTLLYHGYMVADISILCGVWAWKMYVDPPDFAVPPLYAVIIAPSVVAVYIIGLFFKLIYYKFFHPNLQIGELLSGSTEPDEVDSPHLMRANAVNSNDIRLSRVAPADVTDRCLPSPPSPPTHCNKRMKKLAENFYT